LYNTGSQQQYNTQDASNKRHPSINLALPGVTILRYVNHI